MLLETITCGFVRGTLGLVCGNVAGRPAEPKGNSSIHYCYGTWSVSTKLVQNRGSRWSLQIVSKPPVAVLVLCGNAFGAPSHQATHEPM